MAAAFTSIMPPHQHPFSMTATRARSFVTSSPSLQGASNLEQDMTKQALQIVDKAIQAVNPYTAIQNTLHRKDNLLQIRTTLNDGDDDDDDDDDSSLQTIKLQNYQQILVVAFGKASSAMAAAALQQIYPGISSNNNHTTIDIPCSGVVICKDDHATKEEIQLLQQHHIQVLQASHPVPDQRSIDATQQLIELVQSNASPTTLTLCLMSGGGSALFTQPKISLPDLQRVNTLLLQSGMDIQQMNVLRKKLDTAKGGGLAQACYPSTTLSLVLSDVLGDPLDLIASGPTVKDPSTYQDAHDIVHKYQLESQLPKAVMDVLQEGLELEKRQQPNTPTKNNFDNVFEKCQTILVGNNAMAVNAAAHEAQDLGYHPVILGTEIEGEAKEIAKMYVGMARYLQNNFVRSGKMLSSFAVAPSLPVALIAGGETTVTLPRDNNNNNNHGKGGRNQALALSAALELESLGLRNVVLASVGTDGGDGPTDAAGAVVDGTTVASTKAEALQALAMHDSYTYLDSLGNHLPSPPLIKTGPTGTNVADVCVTLIHARQR
jgi:glycerate 2-kinase